MRLKSGREVDGEAAGGAVRVGRVVLPVETGVGGRFGDGAQEVRKANIHNKYGLIWVRPAFDTIPWYMDHASDPHIRQESW